MRVKKIRRTAVLITGGGRGIGKAIAERMAPAHNIIIVGRTKLELAETASQIREKGGDVIYVVGDVADPDTAKRAIETAGRAGWVVRHLICNAGIGKGGPTESFDLDMWKKIIDVNVNGSFYFVQACLPAMIATKRGTICFISSTAGLRGYKSIAAYTASKHGVNGLAKSLALAYADKGIVTVSICPGVVDTDMTTRSIKGLMQRHNISEEDARERVVGTNPQNRIFPPEEVAEMVAFVCSGKVPSLNGAMIPLAGGEV
jgi:3-hydroxybutyrate dehydrogenase